MRIQEPPQIRYATNGDVHVAYQVVGNGPLDLILVNGWISHLEAYWECPEYVSFVEGLASFARVILFDKRGTGLSDRVADIPSLEVRMDDLRVVMDAVGSRQAALFGWSEGGTMCALFAATYPERTTALIMSGAYAKRVNVPGYPWGTTIEALESQREAMIANWGKPGFGMDVRAPSMLGNANFERWWGRLLRQSASPGAAIAISRMNFLIDIRPILSAISVPTLIMHTTNDQAVHIENSRYLARSIPGAKFVECAGGDHVPFGDSAQDICAEVEEFLTGMRVSQEFDRVLATIMFTDIAKATDAAATMGDHKWRHLLNSHHQLVRKELARFRGQELDTAGDGFFAAFDGPARAIRCGRAITSSVSELGVAVRVGIHTGECEIIGDKYGGIAVHTGARVAAEASPGEVLVSSTVKDLVAGSGINFADRGERALKGIPGTWRLFCAQ